MIGTGVFLILLGAFLWAANAGLVNFVWARDWPAIVLVVGIWMLYQGLRYRLKRRRKRSNPEKVLRDLERGKITVEEAERRLRGEE